jgi:hypothetical protein
MSTLADDEVPPTPISAQPASSARSNSFPHHPTTSAAVQSFIDTSQPALNSVPIELDSTPLTNPLEGQMTGLLGQVTGKVKEAVGNVKEKIGESASKGNKGINDPAILNGPVDEPAAEDFEAVQGEDKIVETVA